MQCYWNTNHLTLLTSDTPTGIDQKVVRSMMVINSMPHLPVLGQSGGAGGAFVYKISPRGGAIDLSRNDVT